MGRQRGERQPLLSNLSRRVPASDWETLAVQNYVASLFPDQRGPLITDVAPLTTTGILVSLHSYSNLVLWPWGYTNASAPNDTQLAQLATKTGQLQWLRS